MSTNFPILYFGLARASLIDNEIETERKNMKNRRMSTYNKIYVIYKVSLKHPG